MRFDLLTIPCAAAVGAGSFSYLDYRKAIKSHPAFFLWKALGTNAMKSQ